MVTSTSTRPPPWRSARVLRAVLQTLAAGLVVLVLYVLWFNLTNNLQRQGISTGFEFLDQPFGAEIAGNPLGPGAAIRRALAVGIKNTLALMVVGLPLVTIIGLVVGVARLSSNWLVAKSAAIYVETLRNLPPLLIIFFVFNAVILQLPPITEAYSLLDLFVISNLVLVVTGLSAGAALGLFLVTVAIGVVAAGLVWWWRSRWSDRTGRPHHRLLWSGGVIGVAAMVGYLAFGSPFSLSRPQLDGRVVTGGFAALASYGAVLVALVLYTASHVAEIVRGSIQAVSKGQIEAANALALSGLQKLRFVVLPQAFRIAVPPVINQYLNFTKNTSLALAVGYAEITRVVRQAIGNGQPAPQLILILMLVYLAFSLTISAVANLVNRRLQLVER